MRLDEAVGVITDTETDGRLPPVGSRLQGHPSLVLSWVDVASGSLGQGIGNGVGVALAGKFLDKSRFTCGCCAVTAKPPRDRSGRNWIGSQQGRSLDTTEYRRFRTSFRGLRITVLGHLLLQTNGQCPPYGKENENA